MSSSVLEESITISHIQESHQTIIDSYFGHLVSVNQIFFINIRDDILNVTNDSYFTT